MSLDRARMYPRDFLPAAIGRRQELFSLPVRRRREGRVREPPLPALDAPEDDARGLGRSTRGIGRRVAGLGIGGRFAGREDTEVAGHHPLDEREELAALVAPDLVVGATARGERAGRLLVPALDPLSLLAPLPVTDLHTRLLVFLVGILVVFVVLILELVVVLVLFVFLVLEYRRLRG